MIGAVGEIVGGAGVIVSLLYLARQVRAASLADQRARFEAAQDQITTWMQSVATSGELGGLVTRGLISGRSELKPEEVLRFYLSLQQLLRSYERLCIYAEEGAMHHWLKETFETALRDLIAFPGLKQYWAERRHYYAPAMQREVDALMMAPSEAMLAMYAQGSRATDGTRADSAL
jgi:hypothetical protein